MKRIAILLFAAALPALAETSAFDRARALAAEANWKEALPLYEAALSSTNAAEALEGAEECLRNLGERGRLDEPAEKALAARPDDLEVAVAAARHFRTVPHWGCVKKDVFLRGEWGGKEMLDASERDRVRAVAVLLPLVPAAEAAEPARRVRVEFFRELAFALRSGRQGGLAWRLFEKTDFSALPEPARQGESRHESAPAPVGPDGDPLFHALPESWDAAKTDGERWRWTLRRAAEAYREWEAEARKWGEFEPEPSFESCLLAQFFSEQFSPRTLAGRFPDEDALDAALGVSGLGEDESAAWTARGARRFRVPDDWNPARILGSDKVSRGALGQFYLDRLQFDKAAEAFRSAGDSGKDKLSQIVDPRVQPDGNQKLQTPARPPVVTFSHRNAKKVSFSLRPLDLGKVAADVRESIAAGKPFRPFPDRNLYNAGLDQPWQLFGRDGSSPWLGAPVAQWEQALEPRPGHRATRGAESRAPAAVPAGVYLVEATPEGGEPSHALLRVEALALVGDGTWTDRETDRERAFVTDAETGAPVADAEVGLFAWTCWDDGPTNIDSRATSARTDADGRFRLSREASLFERETSAKERAAGRDKTKTRWADDWILSVAAPGGAHLFCERRDLIGRPTLNLGNDGGGSLPGFAREWWEWGDPDDATWRDGHVPVSVTDRPAYRPGDTVRYKVWLSRRRFDLPDVSPWAGQRVRLVVKNPKDEEVWDKTYVADDFGGFDGEMPVPADAPLGVWTVRVSIHGKGGYGLRLAGTFRVEEYRKPEFEVAVETPAGALELGKEAKATIRARYLFGAPVAGATAKVTVTRTPVPDAWFPPCRWDWLYGGGYCCFGRDWSWHPAWNGGRGWCRPWAWTGGGGWHGWSPPEEVLRTTVELGADGTAEVSWDTAAARAVFGDDADQRYRVAVEVTDAARRTIDAAGEVLAAAKPFRVRAWSDRAVVRAGEPVELRACLAAPDGTPLPDDGALSWKLFRYDPATGEEIPEDCPPPEIWNRKNAPGDPPGSTWRLKPPRGQYRFVATAEDADGNAVDELSVPFTVLGPEGDEARDIRFAPLELVPDKPDYAPGDVARVLVAADEPGAWVHLVLRAGSARAEERWVHLDGKTATVELAIDGDDRPNVFVEAFSVRAGEIRRAARELAVPPASKEARVEVEVPAEARPGEEVEATVRVFGPDGAPAASVSAAMAVYDLAVERFAGGSNVPSLLRRFWGWRLSLHCSRTCTLDDRWWSDVSFDGDSLWFDLGPFSWSGFDSWNFFRDEPYGGFDKRRAKRKGTGFALDESSSSIFLGGRIERSVARAAAPAPEFKSAVAEGGYANAAVAADYARFDVDTDGLPDAFEGAFTAADGALPEVALRTKFADTAFWGPRLRPVPGEPGVFRARFAMPEDVTGWRARVWAVLPGMCVGEGDARLVTRKPFVLRPVLPRFLVEGDIATLSAIVHNDTDEPRDFRVTLSLPETNAVLAVEARPSRSTLQPFNPFNCSTDLAVPAHSSERFDVPVRALREGEAQLELRAVCREGGDGVARTLPVRVHGMQRTESFAAVLAPDRRSATIEFTVPAERRPELSAVELRLETSPLEAMLRAIPFLLEYPHGCTEQTLNRFVPAAIARKALADAGVDLAVFAEHAANWRADYEARGRGGWWAANGVPAAVVDDAELARIVAAGVERLAAMQLSDGGWGWFSGTGERSWPHTTATVVHGLHAARDAGADVPADLLARGERWLAARVAERADEIAKHRKDGWRAGAEDALLASVLAEGGASDARMLDFLFEDRADLPLRAKALLGLAFHRLGDAARRDALVRNCRQFLKEDPATGVWRFETPERGWWWWCDDIEAQSAGLRLLAAAGAEEDAPAVFGLSLYLLQNRRHATFWKSTRDTALAIEALAAAARANAGPGGSHGVLAPPPADGTTGGASSPSEPKVAACVPFDFDIFFDGRQVSRKSLVSDTTWLLLPGPAWELRGDALTPGKHTLEIRWPHKSDHPWLYATVLKTDFTKERPIPPAGLQVKVRRTVERLTPETGAATAPDASGAPVALATTRFAREPLADGAAVRAGDLLEVTLEVEADNDYEYLLLEDRKAAGFEAVDALSGYRWDGALSAYVEHRDDRTCFYLRSLPRGVHSLSYRLRAETPGTLAALPATLAGMYDPDLRANSAEHSFSVSDAPAPRPAAAESAESEPHAESAEFAERRE